jgi:hypothetical protein
MTDPTRNKRQRLWRARRKAQAEGKVEITIGDDYFWVEPKRAAKVRQWLEEAEMKMPSVTMANARWTKTDARKHFRLWWADVKAGIDKPGWHDRAACWDGFVEANIEEGHLPPEARDWVRDA